MRLAWVSPLPPLPSGVSDYSFELLPLLAEVATIDVVCPRPGLLRPLKTPAGVSVVSPDRFTRGTVDYDAVFYHFGNNPLHEFVYELAMTRPGVTVLHDFVLHHLFAGITVDRHRDYQRYGSLLHAEYGASGDRLAHLRIQGVASEFEKFLFPLNRQVATRARTIVVHHQEARDRIHALAPEVPAVVIPHHAGSSPTGMVGIDRAAARTRLGLSHDEFLVGHFGFITPPKQPAAVLGGFARVAASLPESRLLMVGADHTGGKLDHLLRYHALGDKVMPTGHVDLSRFYLYLKAVDAVVNLRYPSAGESSGTFARALAEGRVVIVNNLGSFAEVPPDVALKVEVDGDQAEEVGAHLLRLAGSPEYRRDIETRARHYAATVLDPLRCRDLYLSVARLESLKRSAAAQAPV